MARAVGARPLYFLSLSLGDAFALPLEHQLSLKMGNCAEHVEHQTAGAIGRVDRLIEHLEGDALYLGAGLVKNRMGTSPHPVLLVFRDYFGTLGAAIGILFLFRSQISNG